MFADLNIPVAPGDAAPLAERIRLVLSEFVGKHQDPHVLEALKVRICGEVFDAQVRGEIPEFEPEVILTAEGRDLWIQVIEKQPDRITLYAMEKAPKPSTPPDLDWESRMTREEVNWCWQEMNKQVKALDEHCVDNFRAARIWVSSQRRRFRKIEAMGCCGSINWVEKRWSIDKQRWDLYLLGFNYGH